MRTLLTSVPEKIRTSDLWIRNPMLYPAELRARVIGVFYRIRSLQANPGRKFSGRVFQEENFAQANRLIFAEKLARRIHETEDSAVVLFLFQPEKDPQE